MAYYLAPASDEGAVEVVIAHFNDLGGHVRADRSGRGGIVKLTGAWRKLKSKHPDALLLVAGDMITGSALSTLTRGEGIFRLANKMDINAFAPGNHEFDHGVEQYLKLMEIARFPFVAANLRPMESLGKVTLADAPYVILDTAGIKVGVIGAAHPATHRLTFEKHTRGIEFLDAAQSMRKLVSKVDSEAQLIVALTHIGIESDRRLARKVRGIDIIIGGHSPGATYRPVRIGNTWITHAGEDGNYLGVLRIRLNPDTEKLNKVKGEMVSIGVRTPADPDMAAAVDAEEKKLPIRPDQVIARSAKHYDKNDDIAPWVAAIMKKHTGAELGLVNIGGIRADFEQGPVTYRDVYRTMPFDNRVVIVRLSGEELARWMKRGTLVPDRRFRPRPDKFYKVATMDFIVAQRRISKSRLRTLPLKVRDLMIKDLKRRGTLRL